MAADPKKTKDDEPDAAASESSQKKKKLFMMIGLAVGLVAISIGGTVLALKLLSPSTSNTDAEEEVVEEVKVLSPAIYQLMKPNFTINFNVNGRQRYLQAEVTLMYRDATIEPLLTLHMPAIRNGLVLLFSGKKFEELQTVEGKEVLRKESLEIVQGILNKEQAAIAAAKKAEEGDDEDEKKDKDKDSKKEPEYPNIEQVLFTNFVMQ